MAYPRFVRSRQFKKARRTAGNLSLNSTAWANVDTGLDMTLKECQVGDEIVYGMSSLIGLEGVTLIFDPVTVVAGAPLNSFSARGPVGSGGTTDPKMWYIDSGSAQIQNRIVESSPYTLVAGDLVDGSVTFRLRYATATAGVRTLYAQVGNPLDVWVMNLGPVQV